MANLRYGVTDLALPDDLLWTDEHAWQAVEQRVQYTLTGALLLEATTKQTGRTITLEGGATFAWVPRSTVETLRAWALLPAQQFTLTYRGINRNVAFDHGRGSPLSATQIVEYADPDAADQYYVALRFIEV